MTELLDLLVEDAHQLLLMMGLLVLSAGFSGSETALFSLNTSDINRIRREPGPASRAILALHNQLGDFLMTILFCNMIVNILFFATSTVLIGDLTEIAAQHYGPGSIPFVSFGLGVASLLLVITFGEVTPKSVATVSRVSFCRIVAVPLLLLHRGLWWVRAFLGSLVRAFEALIGIRRSRDALNPEELSLLIEASRADGIISAEEHDLISEVLELPEVRVRELMTPRVDAIAVTPDDSIDAILNVARTSGHSKLPVRDPETDEYVAWVDAREAFVHSDGESGAGLFRQPAYVSELDRTDQVLVRFRQEHLRFAIVVDERGASEGILTLTDLLGSIFSGIGEEDEMPQDPIEQVGENTYLLAGDVSVREWSDLFGIGADLPSVATVGGLVTTLLGRTPHEGDSVRLGNLRLEVVNAAQRRILRIRLTLDPASGEETA